MGPFAGELAADLASAKPAHLLRGHPRGFALATLLAPPHYRHT
ncbi:hypothetical protein F441_23053 [Phytophthora nicotianae CJ01A1]|uniref:Uncharacterized protein n=4 Tax=Phytophthora nicotianae TaxID=4792 RepID=V9DVI8_PHYNI|nr:hypothetical protein F443_22858 [Phytophthora nicotianae P1569]ETK70919.1 hypothetical protein L915_21752 [Phytophthora nicotianae]ETO72637.1 hypothetical protein F444_11323 [Phytophthora nicotianae P1976]ETO99532.1 hypothetical protein F441_23053 [Phytophthora nicotianae CJ01A1]ETL24363.1 hypothetical protein L916_21622 [Phytophthora nicotianae]